VLSHQGGVYRPGGLVRLDNTTLVSKKIACVN